MTITFDDDVYWAEGLRGVASVARVDGKVVPVVMEGRALAEYFGVENERWTLQFTFMRNRAFLEDVVRDAIERGMFTRHGEVLLGEDELTPYFRERDMMLSATNVPA
jgi:Protein of unknown function (DUF1488)